MNGSDGAFYKSISELTAAATFVWEGNKIAILLTVVVVLLAIISDQWIRRVVINGIWLSGILPMTRQASYDNVRRQLRSMKIWAVGTFVISSILFILLSVVSASSAANMALKPVELHVFEFITKCVVVGAVLIRAIRVAVAIRNTA